MNLFPITDLIAIIWLDVILSGDNALVIGLAASSLAPHLQRRAILFGMTMAIVIRVAAALAATYLYEITWVKFLGGIALLWVSWKLFHLARRRTPDTTEVAVPADAPGGRSNRAAMLRAMGLIIVADISMSIDNVLAVAGIAQGNRLLLIIGLSVSIAFMAFFATIICRLLVRHTWVNYIGVVILIFVAGNMLHDSWRDMARLLGIPLF